MKTPLYDAHLKLGARMVDYNGWNMPLFYSGIIDEHRTVRHSAGIFDLSHMGRIEISGEGTFRLLQEETTNDISSLEPGKCRYSLICDESGGIVDDILIYHCGGSCLVVANAVNREAVYERLAGNSENALVSDVSESVSMAAVQGPESERIVREVLGDGITALGTYRFSRFNFMDAAVTASRTGYTGEDGFEIFIERRLCRRLWDELMSAGGKFGMKPAGLGARDTLRMEAGMRLYGRELGLGINPFEAGLERFVSFGKGGFRGRDALLGLKGKKHKKLKGIETFSKAIPRQGCKIFKDGAVVGEVTSGSYSPTLDKIMGMGYIEHDFSERGTLLEVEIRGRMVEVRVVDLPFYKAGLKEVE